MIYALLAPTAIYAAWILFEAAHSVLRVRPPRDFLNEAADKGGRNTVFQFTERPPSPAPMRRHRPF